MLRCSGALWSTLAQWCSALYREHHWSSTRNTGALASVPPGGELESGGMKITPGWPAAIPGWPAAIVVRSPADGGTRVSISRSAATGLVAVVAGQPGRTRCRVVVPGWSRHRPEPAQQSPPIVDLADDPPEGPPDRVPDHHPESAGWPGSPYRQRPALRLFLAAHADQCRPDGDAVSTPGSEW